MAQKIDVSKMSEVIKNQLRLINQGGIQTLDDIKLLRDLGMSLDDIERNTPDELKQELERGKEKQ